MIFPRSKSCGLQRDDGTVIFTDLYALFRGTAFRKIQEISMACLNHAAVDYITLNGIFERCFILHFTSLSITYPKLAMEQQLLVFLWTIFLSSKCWYIIITNIQHWDNWSFIYFKKMFNIFNKKKVIPLIIQFTYRQSCQRCEFQILHFLVNIYNRKMMLEVNRLYQKHLLLIKLFNSITFLLSLRHKTI